VTLRRNADSAAAENAVAIPNSCWQGRRKLSRMIKHATGFIILGAALWEVNPASAQAYLGPNQAKQHFQSMRSADSGYCPGTLNHVYHLSECQHYDQAEKPILAPPTRPNVKPNDR
jgi:hypothetical protein